MYSVENKYLYEILDDYQCAVTDKERGSIFKSFCEYLWKIENHREIYLKYIKYHVSDYCYKDYKDIFCLYSSVPYKAYRSTTDNINPWFLLRQKINNIYTNMCDGSVCTKRDYLELLHVPKKLYYRYIKNKLTMKPDELDSEINSSLEKAQLLFKTYSRQKMNIEWKEYKKLIENWLEKIFNNYICLDMFEDKSNIIMDINYWTEDNYVVKYIGKSLNGYMRNCQKDYYKLPKKRKQKFSRCECGNLFEKHNNKHKYCNACAKQRIKEYDKTRKHI